MILDVGRSRMVMARSISTTTPADRMVQAIEMKEEKDMIEMVIMAIGSTIGQVTIVVEIAALNTDE